jgi:hypothetical protein
MKLYSLLFAMVPIAPVSAAPLSGNELLAICETGGDLAKSGFCAGYMAGAIDGIKWGVSVPLILDGKDTAEIERVGNTVLEYCLPTESTLGQQIDVVLKHLRLNPSTRHNSARSLIQESFKAVFPCQ